MNKFLKTLPIAMLLTATTAWADTPASSADINDLILAPGSIVPEWDMTDPTIYNLNPATGCLEFDGATSKELSFTYTSDVPVVIFIYHDATECGYSSVSSNILYVYRDKGTETLDYNAYSVSSYINTPFNTVWYPSGSHVITLKKSSSSSFPIHKIKILPQSENLSTEFMDSEHNTVTVTWKNDPVHPWVVNDGMLRSAGGAYDGSDAGFTGSFSVERDAVLEANVFKPGYEDEYIYNYVYIDDEQIDEHTFPKLLKKGTHTIKFLPGILISQFLISDKWIEVNLDAQSDLGTEILKQVSNLYDVKNLKITGILSDLDWDGLTMMKSLRNLDLSAISNVPHTLVLDDFYYNLCSLKLPEDIKRLWGGIFVHISDGDATYNIQYLNIPESIEVIGNYFEMEDEDNNPNNPDYIFNECLIGPYKNTLDYGDLKNLKKIGMSMFYYSPIETFEIPENVYFIGENAFAYSNVDYVSFRGTALREIPRNFCYTTYNLRNIIIPEGIEKVGYGAFGCSIYNYVDGKYYNGRNFIIPAPALPSTLKQIDSGAFYNANLSGHIDLPNTVQVIEDNAFAKNKYLSGVTLPPLVGSLSGWLFADTGLTNIKSKRPVPPTYETTTFEGVDLMNITVEVPDFAERAYKSNLWWGQFGQIVGSRELATSDLWNFNSELTLDENHRLYGNPDVNLFPGTQASISGDTEQVYRDFSYSTELNNSSVSCYLSDCGNTKAENEMNVKIVVPENTWVFFSPSANILMSDVKHSENASFVIRRYDGARRGTLCSNSGNWINVGSSESLQRGCGYIVQSNRNGEIILPIREENRNDFFSQNDFSVNIQANPSQLAANAGWNFFGNPYPTYFDIADIDVDAPITIWNGKSYEALSLVDDSFALEPMQAFFVQKPETSEEVIMPRNGRQLTSEIVRKTSRRSLPTVKRDLIDLNIQLADESESFDDKTRVVVNNQASVGYEASADATKFMSLNSEMAQIYSVIDGETYLAINERPYGNGEVELGVYTPCKGGVYSIKASRLDRQAWIYDAATGIEQLLSEDEPFCFISDREGHNAGRFSLRFAPESSSVDKSADNSESINVVGLQGEIMIQAPLLSDVNIFGANGVRCFNGEINSNPLMIELESGLYIVSVNGHIYKCVVK